jgi:hypothetical protein
LVYYDTDGDGRFDLVLFAPKASAVPTQAFRVVKKEGADAQGERILFGLKFVVFGLGTQKPGERRSGFARRRGDGVP